MVLDEVKERKIIRFVQQEPRTIQEISKSIGCSWLTADRYLAKIKQTSGVIDVKTFRGGTKGALKIAFWKNPEVVHDSEAQELLFNRILYGKTKIDFSPFDIYQFVDEKKRYSFIEKQDENSFNIKQDLAGTIKKAEKHLLIFSGDFSWINLIQDNEAFIDIFTQLGRRGVNIKVLTRVDIDSMDNVELALSINKKVGRDVIEIRHSEQPLRGLVIDDTIVRFKEIKNIADYDKKSKVKSFVFYEVYDESWVSWISRVFWNLFRASIDAPQRLEDLKSIKR